MKNTIITLASVVTLSSITNAQTLITGSSNSVDITKMTYERNGSTIIQNTSATTITATNDSVFLKESEINDNGTIKTLKFFNAGGVINNVNLTAGTTNRGVVKNGIKTSIADDGLPAYVSALTATLNDTDINNYAYHDFPNQSPPANVADYDISFANPFRVGDYIAVTERDGNTDFELTALDVNGDVISGANVLKFDSDTGLPGGYDWNLGFSTASYISSQPQWITIAKAELFDTNTSVYGFRIDNNGGADIKFFGISDTPFVPEPSSTLLLGIGGLGLLARRKR